MAGLTLRAALVLTAASTICGCYHATRVVPVELAMSVAAPEESATRTTSAIAAEPRSDEPPLALTLDAALERAVATDPGIAGLRAKATAEAAHVDAADDFENPELRLTNLNFHDGSDRAELALRVRPPLPGTGQAKSEIARSDFERSSADAARARQVLATQVRMLFDLALLHPSAAALAADAAALESRELSLVERELARGVITRADVAERMLDVARTRRECDRTARRFAAAREDLSRLLDLPAATPVVLVGQSPSPGDLEAIEEGALLERALRARPEIRGAAASIDAARAESWLARAEQWPWLSFVQAGYDFQPSGAEAWEAGVALDVPLFSWRRDGVRAAEAEVLVVRHDFAAVVRENSREVHNSTLRARDAADDLKRFREGPAHAAAAARGAAESSRAAGQVSETTHLEAVRRDIEARLTELELTEDYVTAVAELGAAVGDVTDANDAEH